jgi:hypothetical protein
MKKWRVIIEPGTGSAAEVLQGLGGMDLAAHGISVELREPAVIFRSPDPAIIIATISAASANLAALIAGLLQLRANRSGQRITIELSSGDKIEIPADCPTEKIDSLIKSLRKEPPRRIILP